MVPKYLYDPTFLLYIYGKSNSIYSDHYIKLSRTRKTNKKKPYYIDSVVLLRMAWQKYDNLRQDVNSGTVSLIDTIHQTGSKGGYNTVI